ncbi:MAG TPA: membrane protein insertase YidC, partial [Fodinibius sp.]|nr:membrane protein insertase YidC [Fodinibius sp.]
MDRNTVTGLVLIFIVMVAWAYVTMPTEQELRERQAEQARQDSIATVQADSQQAQQSVGDSVARQEQQSADATVQSERSREQEEVRGMGAFSAANEADTSEIAVETPLFKATFTNVGAGPSQIMLKNHETWDHQPVRMIKDTLQSAYSLGFLTNENFNVETDKLVFEQLTPGENLALEEGETGELQYALTISDTQRLLFTYTFNGDSYEIDLDVRFEGLEQTIIGGTVDFGWKPQLRFTEKNVETEAVYVSAYVYTGGEMDQLKLSEAGQDENNYNGSIGWVATRTKFFTQIIKTENSTDGALLAGQQTGAAELATTNHHYQSFMTTDISDQQTVSYQMYVGPMAYKDLKEYHEQAYNMVDVGYSWLRWLSEPLVKYIIIPYFGFVEDFMNVGLAIVLFGVLIKMVLYPLTKKSYRSMAAMKEL